MFLSKKLNLAILITSLLMGLIVLITGINFKISFFSVPIITATAIVLSYTIGITAGAYIAAIAREELDETP